VPAIVIRRHYPHSVAVVWEEMRHIDRHVHWMNDAVAITFTGNQREGVGTSFRCLTKVGPFQLNDLMTVTAWEEGRVMGVAHHGLVTGEGTFTLEPAGTDTIITWREALRMPWYFGGSLGAALAAPVLRMIWKKNLANLARRLDDASVTR
jgi:Polyketide cyclase / dehydrase and lipid transport